MTVTAKFITDVKVEGYTKGRIVTLDDRIVIDEYDPTHPEVRWFCDICESVTPVTAELPIGDGKWLTTCASCLQNALNGIAYSYANPVSFDAKDGAA